jgi:intein/homing endonuclease
VGRIKLSHREYVPFHDWKGLYVAYKSFGMGVIVNPLDESDEFFHCKCVDAKMRVTTNLGILEADQIKPGMKVWRNEWKTVEAVNIETPRNGLRVETKNRYMLRLTPEHRMMVDGKWTQAAEISVGNIMVMSPEMIGASEIIRASWPSDSRMNKAGRPRRDGITRYSTIDPNAFLLSSDVPKIDITPRWGRLLGAYVGDGSVGQRTAMRIACDGQDQDWIDILMEDFKAIGLNPGTESNIINDGKTLRRREVRVSSSHLVRVLVSLGLARMRENGNPVRMVCVPEVIWRSPKKVVAEFLAGYFEADGTTGSSSVYVVSKEECFLRDIQRLLIAFGIVSGLTSRECKCQTGKGTYWTLNLLRDSTDVFEKEIGFKSRRKRARLAEITSKVHSDAFLQITWEDEVVSVHPCMITPVDIQVEGEEYILAGFVSHNSELKFVEAGAMGVPMVVSRVHPFTEIIKEGETGFFASTPEEFADKIMFVLRNRELARKVGSASRDHVRKEYDIRKHARKFMADVLDASRFSMQETVPATAQASSGALFDLRDFNQEVVGPVLNGQQIDMTFRFAFEMEVKEFSVLGATYQKRVQHPASYQIWVNDVMERNGNIPATSMRDNAWWRVSFDPFHVGKGDAVMIRIINHGPDSKLAFYVCRHESIGKAKIGGQKCRPIAVRFE